MVSQLWWTIGPRTVGIGHGGRFEPLDNSRMQAKLGLHKTRTAFPPSPKIPSLRHPDLVMLQPERVWRGDEKLLPDDDRGNAGLQFADHPLERRSEEHTSELQSLMRISYAVFCLKKKK